LLAAGGEVRIESRVAGDAMVAGGSVTLHGPVAGDVRAAGGEVLISDNVGGELAAAGGNVSVPAQTVVGGRAWLSGGHVELAGRVRGPLHVMAGSVRLAGAVEGDVEVTAQEVEVAPGARIDGRLRYRSAGPARIDPSAQIAGGVERLTLPKPDTGPWVQTGLSVLKVLFFLGVVLLGLVVLLLLPRPSLDAARTTRSEPLKSLLFGFALLVSVPIAALLLMISIIGLPLAFALLALYALALLLSWITAALALGDLGLRALQPAMPSRHALLLAFAGGLLLLWLLGYVPIVGGIVRFIALLLGLGAWAVYLYRWLGGRAGPTVGPA
jgi:cytoskeletal protein CcmA (bactofilin family)